MHYDERKAAQAAAFLIEQTPQKRMSHLKLMKLLYLAEREALRRFGLPMFGDRPVSMPHGPVLSMTLNLMDGDVESQPDGWESWISDKENHEVALRRQAPREQLDALSDAEAQLLGDIWARFGAMGKWEVRDWTHRHCAEWRDPKGSSLPIAWHEVARAVGYDEAAAQELALRIEEQEGIEAMLAAL